MEKTMKRVLIVHDISCFGKCSSTVALPILSSMQLTGTLLPSALLSTHTGPIFEGFTFLDLSNEMEKIVSHWKQLNLQFDAIYVGYLGNVQQIHFLIDVIPSLLKTNGKFYLDPVMGDNGKFYPGFDQNYADEMLNLCALADVVMPNQTEASFVYHLPYKEGILTPTQLEQIIDKVNATKPTSFILTGAGFDGNGNTGAYWYDAEQEKGGLIQDDFVGGAFHGTGDIFGSIVVGALVNRFSCEEATALAVSTLPKILRASIEDPNVDYDGLHFESVLADLTEFVVRAK